MNRPFLVAIGVVLFLTGCLWTLQGLGVIGGSAMSGNTVWAIIGPVVALLGVVVHIAAIWVLGSAPSSPSTRSHSWERAG